MRKTLLLLLLVNLATAAAPKREEAPPVPIQEELQFDPMAGFIKPPVVTLLVKIVVYDVHTGQYLRMDTGHNKTVNVVEWEKEHGPFKDVDWMEYQRFQYISVFVDFYEGYI